MNEKKLAGAPIFLYGLAFLLMKVGYNFWDIYGPLVLIPSAASFILAIILTVRGYRRLTGKLRIIPIVTLIILILASVILLILLFLAAPLLLFPWH